MDYKEKQRRNSARGQRQRYGSPNAPPRKNMPPPDPKLMHVHDALFSTHHLVQLVSSIPTESHANDCLRFPRYIMRDQRERNHMRERYTEGTRVALATERTEQAKTRWASHKCIRCWRHKCNTLSLCAIQVLLSTKTMLSSSSSKKPRMLISGSLRPQMQIRACCSV
jgi:predicted secreted protein